MNSEKHEFAFFLENLSAIIKPIALDYNKQNIELKITDKDLMHRLLNIVRLEIGESFIIFDKNNNALCALVGIEKKKSFTIKIIEININKNLEPKINLLLPILKRENLETAIYSAVELGANKIITLITEKSQKNFNQERSTKILIAAAEQSKNFAFLDISAPIELNKYLNSNQTNNPINIFFDAEGENLNEVVKNIKTKLQKNINPGVNFSSAGLSSTNLSNANFSSTNLSCINLMIGPEGDLTESEKILLKTNGFIFCKLTPTILRSFQAVNVGLGIFRALLA